MTDRPNRGGRPRYEVSDERRHVVSAMTANGNTIPVVARALRCSEDTILRYFKAELAHGREDVRASIEMAMIRAALGGNVSAMRTWLARHSPEWRASMVAPMAGEPIDPNSDATAVRFYLPANGRDQPEPEDEGPIIEAEAETAPNDPAEDTPAATEQAA